MSDLDELKKKKERMLLERDIAKLESKLRRKEIFSELKSSVHFKDLAIGCAIFSFLFFLSIGFSGFLGFLLAVVFLLPLIIYFYFNGFD